MERCIPGFCFAPFRNLIWQSQHSSLYVLLSELLHISKIKIEENRRLLLMQLSYSNLEACLGSGRNKSTCNWGKAFIYNYNITGICTACIYTEALILKDSSKCRCKYQAFEFLSTNMSKLNHLVFGQCWPSNAYFRYLQRSIFSKLMLKRISMHLEQFMVILCHFI